MKKIILALFFTFLITTLSKAEVDETCLINASITKNRIKKDVVVYNLSNGKLHTHDCEWAEKCTKNCIYIKKRKLKKIFFIPCVVCGGGILEPAENYSDNH